ncbi:MAG: hypothetical protein R2780_12380 [Crocinitomicaceae bacterium]|nr:hypothetical protein [Crocinitomicaceae bacterium]
MRFTLAILLIPVLLLLSACPASDDLGTNNNDLPEKAEDLVIRMDDGGGMLPVWLNIYISKDSAYWSYNRYRNETVIRWVPTPEEMDKLYSNLKENDFHKIVSDCENEVYDRGGRNYQISVGGKDYQINNSGNCFIQEKWVEKYRNISGFISNYYQSKIDEQILNIPVLASNQLIELGYRIDLRFNDAAKAFTLSADTNQIEAELYPGSNEFVVQLFYKDSLTQYKSPAQFKYEQFFEDISTSTKSVLIDWIDGNIEVIPRED